jgi:hypothetical protein
MFISGRLPCKRVTLRLKRSTRDTPGGPHVDAALFLSRNAGTDWVGGVGSRHQRHIALVEFARQLQEEGHHDLVLEDPCFWHCEV